MKVCVYQTALTQLRRPLSARIYLKNLRLIFGTTRVFGMWNWEYTNVKFSETRFPIHMRERETQEKQGRAHTPTHSVQSQLQLLSHASLTRQPQQGLTTADWNTVTCSFPMFHIPQRAHTHTTHKQRHTLTRTLHLHHIPRLFASGFILSAASSQPFLSLIFLHSYVFIAAWQSAPTSPISSPTAAQFRSCFSHHFLFFLPSTTSSALCFTIPFVLLHSAVKKRGSCTQGFVSSGEKYHSFSLSAKAIYTSVSNKYLHLLLLKYEHSHYLSEILGVNVPVRTCSFSVSVFSRGTWSEHGGLGNCSVRPSCSRRSINLTGANKMRRSWLMSCHNHR